MLVYYFVPFIVSNRYLLFWVSNGHNSVSVQNRTHVYMNFFDHKDLGNRLLQLCPKVLKHPVYSSQHFPFGAVFVCQAGNFWTQLRMMRFSQLCHRIVIPSVIHRCVIRRVAVTFRTIIMASAPFMNLVTTRPKMEGHIRENINPHGGHSSKNHHLSYRTTLFLRSKIFTTFFSWLDNPR